MAGPSHHGPRASSDRLLLPLILAVALICTASILLLDTRPRGRPEPAAQQQQQQPIAERAPVQLNVVDRCVSFLSARPTAPAPQLNPLLVPPLAARPAACAS